jgi:cell wall-associated NlpC family hydrolase
MKLVAPSVLPMFAEPDTASEQVSQALLGVAVEIVAEDGRWRRIRTPDRYEGWSAAEGLADPPDGWHAPFAEVVQLRVNLREAPDFRRYAATTASIGVRLPLVERRQGFIRLLLPDSRRLWTEAKRASVVGRQPLRPKTAEAIIRTARLFLGTPYLWGGCSPAGLDCSGLVQLVMRLHGIELERDATPQFGQGVAVERPAAADLVFFAKPEERDRVTHVGLMLDADRFLHAYGSDEVRIDRLSDPEFGDAFRGWRRYL